METLRIDKLLWHLRLSRSRSAAQAMVLTGHIRLNGNRVEKSSAEVKAGDRLTFPRGPGVIAIRVLTIPQRRGPASEAQACYQEI